MIFRNIHNDVVTCNVSGSGCFLVCQSCFRVTQTAVSKVCVWVVRIR